MGELDLMDKPEIDSGNIAPFLERSWSYDSSSSSLRAPNSLAPGRNRQEPQAHSFGSSDGHISCRTSLLPFHSRFCPLLSILVSNHTGLHKRSPHNYIHPLFLFQTFPRQFFTTWNCLLRPSQIQTSYRWPYDNTQRRPRLWWNLYSSSPRHSIKKWKERVVQETFHQWEDVDWGEED